MSVVWSKLLPVVTVLMLGALRAKAHDPLDCSTRGIVAEREIQITCTVGSDGARQILSAGGMAPAEVADATRGRGPHDSITLPQTVAALLFELKDGEDKLSASAVNELSDGTEVIFTLVYPCPAAGRLDVRAQYFENVPNMRAGAFLAYDEQNRRLCGVVFSRASVAAQFELPQAKAGASSNAVVAVAAVAPTAGSPTVNTATQQAQHRAFNFAVAALLAVLVVGASALFTRRVKHP